MSDLSEPAGFMDPIAQLRVPPHSIEAESSVLGGLLLSPAAWDLIGGMLGSSDFFRHEHQLVYTAISELANASKQVDVVTVYDQLQRAGKGEDAGGLAYLNALAQFVPSASNIRRYAEIVRERSILRKLVSASDEIASAAFNPDGKSVEKILDDAEQKIFTIGLAQKGGAADDWQDPDAAMVVFLDAIQRRSDGEEDFISTGLRDVDEKLDGGMRPGEVIVIAARPSMGKTALALSIGENVASAGAPVGLLSMEMLRPQIHGRRVSMRSRVPLHKIKRPERMNDYDWTSITQAVDEIRQQPMYVSDHSALTIHQVRSRARALKRKHGLRLLIIDYIGLMEGTDRKANRATQLGEVSRGVKALAKELGMSVLLLAQLNRDVEKRPNARPQMSDLRECGDIEQDADAILFVHRPYQIKPDMGAEWKDYAEIILGKQRDGATGSLPLQFIGECLRFTDWPLDQPVPRAGARGGDL